MTEPAEYTPPKVWTWNKESGGKFASINRPIAGADPRQGVAGRHAIRCSFIRWRRRTA